MTEQQIHKGWQMVKFGDIAKHISKRVEPTKTDLEIYVGLEHLDPDSLKIKRHGVPSDVEGQKLLVKKGQIIFGKRRAYQRKVAVADWDCICSAHAMVLEANPENVIPEFLPFFMQSDIFMNRAVAISEGSLSPTIKWKVLENQMFYIPSIDVQKSLVKILLKLERVISTCEESISTLERLCERIISDVMNGKLLREVKGIKKYKIKNVAQLFNGRAYKLSEWEENGTPIIRLQNLTGTGDKYYYSTMKLDSDKYCENGDLLYMWSATFGPYIWSGEKAIYHYHIWKVVCNETMIRKMFMFYLLKYFTALWMDKSNGMGILHITKTTMENTEIQIPNIDTQDHILDQVLEIEATLNACKEKLKKLFILKSSIIHGCVKKAY